MAERLEDGIHYAQYARLVPKIGRASARQRATSALASHVLSREFGESIETFAARSPRYRELKRFLRDYPTTP